MNEKSWYQSRTILAAIIFVLGALGPFVQAVQDWVIQGHNIPGLIAIVWPAVAVLYGVLNAYFRKSSSGAVIK